MHATFLIPVYFIAFVVAAWWTCQMNRLD